MSQLLIQQYLNNLQDLRKVSGTHRESVVSEAFKDLLKGWGRAHDLVFVPQYEITTTAKDRRYVDGAEDGRASIWKTPGIGRTTLCFTTIFGSFD